MLNLAALPWTAAQRSPNAPALHDADGATLTFRDLDQGAAGVAALLARRGTEPGQRVAICCGNTLTFPVLYYGVLRAQAVVVLLPTTAPPADLAATIKRLHIAMVATNDAHAGTIDAAIRSANTGAQRIVLNDTGLAALLDHPRTAPQPVDPKTPAVILGTSGTTGTPRAAMHSHIGLLLNARAVAGEMLHLDEHDVQLGALPMPHSFGMSAVLNASVLTGASVTLMQRFDTAQARRLIDQHGITVLQAVPTMFARLVADATHRPATLRLTVVSGAPLPAGLATKVRDRLCSTIVERYGMTEVSPLTMREVPDDGGEPGDVGHPLQGVTVRVRDGAAHGELEATAPSMFLGYADDPAATSAALHDGFLRTGDLGRVDAGGRVVLSGRLKDLIIRGGHNVAAREVEHVLEAHPGVADVAVLGLPDADLGEEVAAVLVLRNGQATNITADLRTRCRELLTAYKRPRLWFVLDDLPRTASGKVRKDALRDALASEEPILSEP